MADREPRLRPRKHLSVPAARPTGTLAGPPVARFSFRRLQGTPPARPDAGKRLPLYPGPAPSPRTKPGAVEAANFSRRGGGSIPLAPSRRSIFWHPFGKHLSGISRRGPLLPARDARKRLPLHPGPAPAFFTQPGAAGASHFLRSPGSKQKKKKRRGGAALLRQPAAPTTLR